jgi:hypothetical protein
MTSINSTLQSRGFRQFSLRQALIAIFGLAIGFAIWRSPKGDWSDIPIWTLNLYFVISLAHHFVAQRRWIAHLLDLSDAERWAARLNLCGILGLALTLVIACVLRLMGANEWALTVNTNEIQSEMLVQYASLPRDLAILGMLASLGLNYGASAASTKPSVRRKIYGVSAAAGLLIGILVFVANCMFVTVLVYFAVSGIEAVQSARLLPPEMNVPTALRTQRFIFASGIGIGFLIANLVLVLTIRKWWNDHVLRWILMPLVAAGITAQCLVVHWFVVYGIRQLQPEFADTFLTPPLAGAIVIGMIVSLAGIVAAWKLTVKSPAKVHGGTAWKRAPFFHESWLAGALLGTCTASLFVQWTIKGVIDAFQNSFPYNRFGWTIIPGSLIYYPWEFIWWAAAIGGFSSAWNRWHRRKNPIVETACEINPAQFWVTFVGLLLITLAAAPILAAASFSYGLMRYPKPF